MSNKVIEKLAQEARAKGMACGPGDGLTSALPVETCAKCRRCGMRLGAQDPGHLCGFCKFVGGARPR